MNKIEKLIERNRRTIRDLDVCINNKHSISILNENRSYAIAIENALTTLQLITELDPELNDAETYREVIREILEVKGWV